MGSFNYKPKKSRRNKMNRQETINSIYTKWNSNAVIPDYDAFKETLTAKEKATLQLEKFDGQVNNGGFSQWHDNGYDVDLADILNYLKKAKVQNIQQADEVLNLLEQFAALSPPEVQEYSCDCDKNEDCFMCEGYGYYTEDGYDAWNDEVSEIDSAYYALYITTLYDEIYDRFDEEVVIPVEKPVYKKPSVKLIGQDGNVFNLIAITKEALRKAGEREKAEELSKRCLSADDYSQVLSIISEYVDIC